MAKKEKKINLKIIVILAFVLAVSIFFWTSSILIFVCMLPSIAYWFVDKTIQKSKTLTVAAMNFTGCFYYLCHVWKAADPIEKSMDFITSPITIIVCYSMAVLGYIINYMTVFVSASFDREKAEKRITVIDKEKSSLEKRWGKKVRGDTPLDEKGFPLELGEEESDEAQDGQSGQAQ